MPKVSWNPDDAKTGGGGVEAGNYEVTSAKTQVLKIQDRDAQLYLVLGCNTLDKEGGLVRGADPVEIDFSFGQKSLASFHPGQASGPDDPDPKDMGDGVDAEGNTLAVVAEGEVLNKGCGAVVFYASLVKLGFPKTILARGYAPDLVGLKFELATEMPKVLNETLGLRLNTKPMADRRNPGQTVDITYKVAKKWLNPKYLDGGSPAATESKSASNGDLPKTSDPAEISMAILRIVAGQRPGAKGTIKTKQSLIGFFTNAFTKSKSYDQKKLAECQALVKDPEWISGAVAEIGGEVGYDDDGKWNGTVTFPELTPVA